MLKLNCLSLQEILVCKINLNTSHVKVKLESEYFNYKNGCNLNTSHVKVKRMLSISFVVLLFNLNTSHVKVKHRENLHKRRI